MAIDWTTFDDSFSVFEDRTISLTSVRNSGNVTTTGIAAARGKVSWKVMQAVMAAGYVRPEVMYSIRKSQAAGPWKPGDLLTDASQEDATGSTGTGITYTLQYADADEAFWVVAGMNPKVTYNLRHTIDIFLNEVTKDEALSIKTQDETLAYGEIPARVHPVMSSFQEIAGKQGTGSEWLIELYPYPNTIQLTHNHFVEWANPETGQTCRFTLKAWDSDQQIDRLMEIKAELVP